MPLLGKVEKSVDFKGRLSIPKKLRESLVSEDGGKMALLVLDGCIQIFPWRKWLKIEEAIMSLPMFEPVTRELQRTWGESIEVCELDREGRVGLSKALKDAAGIEKDVVLVGAFTRLEVWAKEKYTVHRDQRPTGEKLARVLAKKGHSLSL